MTSAGYIADQRCPSQPEHGVCHDLERGYYCPHSDHHHPILTQNFWTFDEWEHIKSLPPIDDPATPLRTKVKKRNVRRARPRRHR